MISKTCRSCVHFRQHYVLDSQSCSAVNCGHCTCPRMKHRKADTPACVHYLPRETAPDLPDRHAVTHYLTTRMLDYILTLELPPEIK